MLLSSCLIRRAVIMRRHVNRIDLLAGQPKRHGTFGLMWWINKISNQVEVDRIKEVGPEQAAAEWLIRNGAKVKWRTQNNWQVKYERDPNVPSDDFLEAIDGTDSSIMSIGFDHLENLRGVDQVVLRRCPLLDDEALNKLSLISHSLNNLHIISCYRVTDTGINYLVKLKNLNYLKIFDLPEVKDAKKLEEYLKSELPDCHVCWPRA
ncbi:ATP synthase subunit s, mitochondrial [Brevipalpus obovatus]|uniref:ATP synthase subunit s, mitochondrial n=1 Tax=Brevipalpus obovatus TaxID=246614 RepID=UPI003D9E71A7